MLFDCGEEEVDEVALPKLLALHHQTKPNHHHRGHRRLQTIIITKAMHWNIFRHSQIKKPSNLGEKDVWTFPADPPSLRIFTYALTLCTRMWSSLAEVVSPMFAQGLGALSAFYHGHVLCTCLHMCVLHSEHCTSTYLTCATIRLCLQRLWAEKGKRSHVSSPKLAHGSKVLYRFFVHKTNLHIKVLCRMPWVCDDILCAPM